MGALDPVPEGYKQVGFWGYIVPEDYETDWQRFKAWMRRIRRGRDSADAE